MRKELVHRAMGGPFQALRVALTMRSPAIIKLLRDLHEQAQQHGGAVYMLNGNHESLNICGDFRWDNKIFRKRQGIRSEAPLWLHLLDAGTSRPARLLSRRCSPAWESKTSASGTCWLAGGTPSTAREVRWPWSSRETPQCWLSTTRALFMEDYFQFTVRACSFEQRYLRIRSRAQIVATHPLLHCVVNYGVEKLNAEVSSWMRAEDKADGGKALPPFLAMGDSSSVMWNRTQSKEKWTSPSDRYTACRSLQQALAKIGASRLIVGHTPQVRSTPRHFPSTHTRP